MTVRQAKSEDCHEINTMMVSLIDEIYARESDEVRGVLKANFTESALTELCGDEHALLYVVDDGGQPVAFLYGWLFQQVFTMYWIYSQRPYRGRGAVKMLLAAVEKDLLERGCLKIEMWAYAENNRFIDFSARLGFEKGVLIAKSMFGFRIQNLHKTLGPGPVVLPEKRIKIVGEAGQGIKLLSFTLAQVLAMLGNEVSLTLDYDANVRGGQISADLVYGDRPIENPIIDEADVLIKFTRTREWFPAKTLVIDESFCVDGATSCEIKNHKGTLYGFQDTAISVFGSKVFVNMIALGRILRYIGINILLLNIKDLLPPRAVEKNLEAIKYGFNYRDAV